MHCDLLQAELPLPSKSLFQRLQQCSPSEWFFQESSTLLEDIVACQELSGVTGHEYDLDFRPGAHELSYQFGTAHASHDDIG